VSLEINSDNDYVVRDTAANLGSVTAGSYLGWYFKNDSSVNDLVMTLTKSSGSSYFRTRSATTMQARAVSNSNVSAEFAANNGEWHQLAITVTSAGVFTFFHAPAAGPLAEVYSFSSGNGNTIAQISAGQNGGYYTSARGCYRYCRYFAGRVLTLGELEAEFAMTPDVVNPSADPANLFLSWALGTGTDTTDLTGNGNAPTISGAVTSAEEPTIGGGGASVFIPTQYRRTNSLLRM